MKNYFPDDPVKQEMLEDLVNDIKTLLSGDDKSKVILKIESLYRYNCISTRSYSSLRSKVEIIEKATNEKIEEVLK